MNNVKNNKSLRVFLALCLLVQLVLPGMVWESKATGDPTITVDFGDSTAAAATDLIFYQLLTGTAPGYELNSNYLSFLTAYDGTMADEDSVITFLETQAELGSSGQLAFANALATSFITASTPATSSYVINSTNLVADFSNATLGKRTVTLPVGYYLIASNDGNDVFPATMMVVTEDVTIYPKGDLPTVLKEIQHNEYSTHENNSVLGYVDGTDEEYISSGWYGWGNVGDNQMGDKVNFRITVTLPSTIKTFTDETNSFFLVLDDIMLSHQFTYNNDLTLKVDGTTTDISATSEFTLVENATDGTKEGWTFTVELDDPESQYLNTTLTLEYSATLMTTAYTGSTPNENNIYMYYSKFNSGTGGNWDGELEDLSSNFDEDVNVVKERDVVYDYTFVLNVTKIDDQADDGEGIPAGFLEGAEFQILLADSSNLYFLQDSSDTTKYYVVNSSIPDSTDTIETDKDGKFSIHGLDDTTVYTLKEINPPKDYVLTDETIEFQISTDYNTSGGTLTEFAVDIEATPKTGTAGTGALTTDTSTGIDEDTVSSTLCEVQLGALSTTIVNLQNDITLPETGGMGTVMFYVAGIGMMAAAGFLIYKRKES